MKKAVVVALMLLAISNVAYADDMEDFKNGMLQWQADKLKQNSSQDWVKSAEFKLNFNSDSRIEGRLGFVKPIYKDNNHISFLQSRLDYSSQDTEMHAGLGYRRFIAQDKMIGFNIFDDKDNTGIVRSSIGFEYFIAKTEVHANYYFPRNGSRFDTSSGVDYQVKVELPYVPWASVGFKGYNWRGDSKYAWNINMQATSHLALEYQYRKGNDSYIGFKYDFINETKPAAFERGKDLIRIEKVNIKDKATSKVIRSESFNKNL